MKSNITLVMLNIVLIFSCIRTETKSVDGNSPRSIESNLFTIEESESFLFLIDSLYPTDSEKTKVINDIFDYAANFIIKSRPIFLDIYAFQECASIRSKYIFDNLKDTITQRKAKGGAAKYILAGIMKLNRNESFLRETYSKNKKYIHEAVKINDKKTGYEYPKAKNYANYLLNIHKLLFENKEKAILFQKNSKYQKTGVFDKYVYKKKSPVEDPETGEIIGSPSGGMKELWACYFWFRRYKEENMDFMYDFLWEIKTF